MTTIWNFRNEFAPPPIVRRPEISWPVFKCSYEMERDEHLLIFGVKLILSEVSKKVSHACLIDGETTVISSAYDMFIIILQALRVNPVPAYSRAKSSGAE